MEAEHIVRAHREAERRKTDAEGVRQAHLDQIKFQSSLQSNPRHALKLDVPILQFMDLGKKQLSYLPPATIPPTITLEEFEEQVRDAALEAQHWQLPVSPTGQPWISALYKVEWVKGHARVPWQPILFTMSQDADSSKNDTEGRRLLLIFLVWTTFTSFHFPRLDFVFSFLFGICLPMLGLDETPCLFILGLSCLADRYSSYRHVGPFILNTGIGPMHGSEGCFANPQLRDATRDPMPESGRQRGCLSAYHAALSDDRCK
eukprot:g10673.t1